MEINKQLATNEFATLLCKGVIKRFEELSFYKKLFPETPEILLKQEIAALDAFEILLATSSYYKDKTRGKEIFQLFLKKYEHKLIGLKIFSDISACDKFMETRIKSYGEAVDNPKNNNPLEDLSFLAVKLFGTPNISNAVAITEVFANSLQADVKFIKQIEESHE